MGTTPWLQVQGFLRRPWASLVGQCALGSHLKVGTAHSASGQWTRPGMRAEDRSFHSEAPFSTVPGLSRCGGPARSDDQEEEGRVHYLGRNPEKPALTGASAQQLSSIAQTQATCWEVALAQGQGGRFADGAAWNGSRRWSGRKGPLRSGGRG